jgi:hypothetical protein
MRLSTFMMRETAQLQIETDTIPPRSSNQLDWIG